MPDRDRAALLDIARAIRFRLVPSVMKETLTIDHQLGAPAPVAPVID